MFEDKTPLSSIALDNDLQEFLAFKHMHVVVMQNLDKRTDVVNGQLATIVNSQNNTLLLEFPNGKTTFTYPVTTTTEEGICIMPLAWRTLCRSARHRVPTSKNSLSGSITLQCLKAWHTLPCLGYAKANTLESLLPWSPTNSHRP